MNPILEIERRMNAVTSQEWTAYASHRSYVMRAISAAREALPETCSAPSLCILGAGNLNDVDLAELREFDQIHLVDIDRDALDAALARQLSRLREIGGRITMHAPVDVSGISGLLPQRAQFRSAMPQIAAALNTYSPSLSATFDVIASTCLISQLMRQINDVFQPNEVERQLFARLVRNAHVRILPSMLSPGGVGVIVTELSGTSIAPAELSPGLSIDDCDEAARRLVAAGKHSAGWRRRKC